MTELAETTILRTPLEQMHSRLGAIMIERDGWLVPTAYGNSEEEYAAVRERGAGLLDLSSRGRMLVSGTEAVPFLNGLVTNDMKTLAVEKWMPAVFPNVQGRLIASVRIAHLKDDPVGKASANAFLIDTEAVTNNTVVKTLERFTLAGDFQVIDVTNSTALLSVQGKRAAQIIQSVFSEENILELQSLRQLSWRGAAVTLMRASHTGETGFDLMVAAGDAERLWTALSEAGARPVGYDALEILRIEAGLPRYGVDMDDTNVVTETNLDEAVSYTKGCYIGQEIIARIRYRGHVAKKLSGISFATAAAIRAGDPICSVAGKEIGRITSGTFSPKLNRTVALAYLKYDFLSPGIEVKVAAGERQAAGRVVDLPFIS